MIIIFINYAELSPNKELPTIKENLQNEPYNHKAEILHFLNNGVHEFARFSRTKDCFTGERIPQEVIVMSSGDYMWSNELAWYVDKYNLRLPKEFEDYILSKEL